jgi:hypothetical protein
MIDFRRAGLIQLKTPLEILVTITLREGAHLQGSPKMPTSVDRDTVISLEGNIESMLEEFSIDKSTISEGFDFAFRSPPELIERFIEDVVRDSIGSTAPDGTAGTARPIVELLFATYRDQPQPEDARMKVAIALMSEAMLRTPGATPQDFVIAAGKQGLLKGNYDNFVDSLVKQVLEMKENIYPGAHVFITRKGRDLMKTMVDQMHALQFVKNVDLSPTYQNRGDQVPSREAAVHNQN